MFNPFKIETLKNVSPKEVMLGGLLLTAVTLEGKNSEKLPDSIKPLAIEVSETEEGVRVSAKVNTVSLEEAVRIYEDCKENNKKSEDFVMEGDGEGLEDNEKDLEYSPPDTIKIVENVHVNFLEPGNYSPFASPQSGKLIPEAKKYWGMLGLKEEDLDGTSDRAKNNSYLAPLVGGEINTAVGSDKNGPGIRYIYAEPSKFNVRYFTDFVVQMDLNKDGVFEVYQVGSKANCKNQIFRIATPERMKIEKIPDSKPVAPVKIENVVPQKQNIELNIELVAKLGDCIDGYNARMVIFEMLDATGKNMSHLMKNFDVVLRTVTAVDGLQKTIEYPLDEEAQMIMLSKGYYTFTVYKKGTNQALQTGVLKIENCNSDVAPAPIKPCTIEQQYIPQDCNGCEFYRQGPSLFINLNGVFQHSGHFDGNKPVFYPRPNTAPWGGGANPSPQNQPFPWGGGANPGPQNQPNPFGGGGNPGPQNSPNPFGGGANPDIN
jgi:hypothetical protein